ncbi:MAG: hypothetical protein ABI680_16155 [Chthoniobacteraceae bacterium]
MSLTDEQKKLVAAWIEEGLKPSDIQSRLESEFNLRVTYMDVRFLIDDLKLMPKDPEPPPAPVETPPAESAPAPAPAGAPAVENSSITDDSIPSTGGGVSVKVDSITRPGAMVSGRVTFSDGKTAEWYLDQMGRLGMVPPEPGYRPAEKDVTEFQAALERELSKMGM